MPPAILSTLAPVFSTLHEAKTKQGLSFEQIAQKIGRSEWYTAAIFYGQAKPEAKDLKALGEALNIPHEQLDEALGDSFFPCRGLDSFPPQGMSC
jgi:cyanate lyase